MLNWCQGVLWWTACSGSWSREGVRPSDVWNRGPDGHAASSSRDAVVAQDFPFSNREERSPWEKKERFVFTQPPESDFGLKRQENGDRSVKQKSA